MGVKSAVRKTGREKKVGSGGSRGAGGGQDAANVRQRNSAASRGVGLAALLVVGFSTVISLGGCAVCLCP